MKKLYLYFIPIFLLVIGWNFKPSTDDVFIFGTPDIASINALAFGPEGVLFIGDSKNATIYAIDTQDNMPVEKSEGVELEKVDEQIASVLGTKVENISIQDMVVNPISKNIYVAVHAGDGSPALLKIQNGEILPVKLSEIKYAKSSIQNAPAEDAKDNRGRSLRVSSISDLIYSNGKVMVSGLSNQEFSSTFRSIDYPFNDKHEFASLEIYHAAHGRYETYAPIKTFTTANINGEEYLLASYTCTPLVIFPLKDLHAGKHIKGRTIAEFGNGNTPLDMITMEKEGKSYLLMSNSNRPVMKVKYEDIATFKASLTEPVSERSATAGVEFISFPMVNVVQLDKLDNNQFVILQRKSNGSLDLWTANDRWL